MFFYSEAAAGNVDPYLANVSLLLKGDGTNGSTNFIDSSNNNFTITAYGNTIISTAQSKFGGSSVSFDGNGDYLDISSNSSAFAFGTGDFTVEFWIKTAATNGNILNPASGSGGTFWGILLQNSGLRWNSSYNSVNQITVNASSILDDNWHHVAFVRYSNTLTCYFDGIWSGNATADTSDYTYLSFPGMQSDKIRIGKGNIADFNGYIDNLRITKGVARYSGYGNFTPPGAF